MVADGEYIKVTNICCKFINCADDTCWSERRGEVLGQVSSCLEELAAHHDR